MLALVKMGNLIFYWFLLSSVASAQTQFSFQLFNVAITAAEALEDCRNKGGDLASVHSSGENEEVRQLLLAQGVTIAWIGLTDFGDEAVVINGICQPVCNNACLAKFRWTDGSPNDFTNFVAGEPNSGCCTIFFGCVFDSQDCVAIQSSGGWNDVSCDATGAYVCKFDILEPIVNETNNNTNNNNTNNNNDLGNNYEYDDTTGIIILSSIVLFAGIGLIAIAAFFRKRYNKFRDTSQKSVKYAPNEEPSRKYPSSFKAEVYDTNNVDGLSVPKSTRISVRSEDSQSSRFSNFSLGAVIASKYFSGSRASSNINEIRSEKKSKEIEQIEPSDPNLKFPVVSKLRL